MKMKSLVLFVSFFMCYLITDAQKFAGVTSGGGLNGGGMAFRINADGSQFVDLKDFVLYPGQARIILNAGGTIIYGIAWAGVYNGILFSMNADGTNFQTLHTFDITTGAPYTTPILASDGSIYGTTGSTNIPPTIYKINTDGSGFTVVHRFPLGANVGSMYESMDGKLYCATFSNGGGIISINKDGTGLVNIHDFSANQGPSFYAPLIQDSNGIFYGVGPGGANGNGQIFTLQPDGSGFTDIFDFGSPNGQNPTASLTLGLDGKLYGSTNFGGANSSGTLFSINKNGSSFLKIFDLNATDGAIYDQKLLQDAGGMLYGGTTNGGGLHGGIIFKIKTDGTLYQKIYDYENNNPTDSQSGGNFVMTNSSIFGANFNGAAFGAGDVFTLQFDGSGYSDLHDFGGAEGGAPYGKLIQGKDSVLYATTQSGGIHSEGIMFSMKPSGLGFTKLFDFGGSNGSAPNDGPVQGSDGTLYGTTIMGGANGVGTIYSIQPNGSGFTKLLDANSALALPLTAPIVGLDGNLYGVAINGGAGQGGIYSCKPDGSNLVNLFSFDSTTGGACYGPLTQGSDGVLFGAASYGGANNGGVLFSILPNGTAFTKLHEFSFTGGDGTTPASPPIIGQDGNLYGFTYAGGTGAGGTFYTVQKDGTNYKKMYDFQTSSGYTPIGSIVQAGNGLFYGIASNGGKNNTGVIFSIQSDGTQYTDLYDFPAGTSFYTLNGLTLLKLRKQTVNFGPIAETVAGGPTINLTASASTNMTVNFSTTTPSLIQVNGTVATTLSPGKATIVATQPGDGVYDVAMAQQSFCIDPPTPSITVSSVAGVPVSLNSSSAGGNQWFLNNVAISGANGQTLALSDTGKFNLQVTIGGCKSTIANVHVVQTSQTISFGALNPVTFGTASSNLSATASSGLTVSYSSSDTTVARITGSTITIVGAGVCMITANQPGNNYYSAAQPVVQSLTVGKASQTINFNSQPPVPLDSASRTLSASSSSGLQVVFTSSSTNISISGAKVSLLSAGVVTINADQPGNKNYSAAATVSQTFCVDPSKPTISLSGPANSILTSSAVSGNQWFFNGVAIPDSTRRSLAVKQSGNYTVQASAGTCVSVPSMPQAVVITEVVNIGYDKDVISYPDPADEVVTLDLSSLPPGQVQIQVLDILGNSRANMAAEGTTRVPIEVSSWSVGVYIWRVTQQSKLYVGKFIRR